MGRLIYMFNVSLDGYVETADHGLEWTAVDDELHSWFNDQTRELEAELYGRRLWELMSGHWPYAEDDPNSTETEREFSRLWKATPKIVFSSSLTSVEGNARLVRGDVAEELAKAREEFPGNIGVGGATLASSFIKRGLVDEFRLVVHPVFIGAGTPYFPRLDEPLRLELFDTRRFKSGVTYLGYRRA
jgi:dihydrofolate reductase